MPQDYADTYRPNMGFFLTKTSTLGWKKEGMSWKNRADFFQHFDQSKIDSKCIDLLRALGNGKPVSQFYSEQISALEILYELFDSSSRGRQYYGHYYVPTSYASDSS
eukprot:g71444.t1